MATPCPEGRKPRNTVGTAQILNKYWMESLEFHSFKELFINVILKQGRLKVSSGMCLGLGSLTASWDGKPHGSGSENRSLCQLVAFEACIELLREYLTFEPSMCILMHAGTKNTISDIYFRDPVLNELDRAFLSSRGYVILNTPESESHVTENTFVFTPGADWVVCLSPINTPFPPTLYITRDMTRQAVFCCEPPKPNRDRGDKASLTLFSVSIDAESPRFQPGEGEQIPKYNPLDRQLVRSFLSTRLTANLDSIHPDLYRWFSANCIHYRPDSGEGTHPVVFEYTDGELYDEERADKYWIAKGCKWLRLSALSN